MNYHFYILWSEKLQRYYVGSTNNLSDRLHRHNSGYEKYTSKGVPWVMISSFEVKSRSEAVTLEKKIKSRGIRRYLDEIK